MMIRTALMYYNTSKPLFATLNTLWLGSFLLLSVRLLLLKLSISSVNTDTVSKTHSKQCLLAKGNRDCTDTATTSTRSYACSAQSHPSLQLLLLLLLLMMMLVVYSVMILRPKAN
jgi:hypothetical protein